MNAEEWQQTSESWRLAHQRWQKWATVLCQHPEHGQLGDELMREELGRVVAEHRRLVAAIAFMSQLDEPAVTAEVAVGALLREAERLGWSE